MISVFGSYVGEEEIKQVSDCMKSQWVGFGKNVEIFEEKYKEKFGIDNFAMVDSGSNALFLAITLLDLPKGSEVILPSFTWVSCAQAVLMAGLKPIFCDVELDTMNVTEKHIDAKITENTSAIMVVHYAGLPVEMDEIINLGFPVIEDAAHAVCSKYRGQPCGTIGDIGIFSYDAVKNMTTGEGGGITTRDPQLIEKAKTLRYCGVGKSGFDSIGTKKDCWWKYDIAYPFIKMLPTNMAAGIGIAQLDRIDELQKRRKAIWDYYNSEFSSFGFIYTPIDAYENDVHSYFTYCIKVPDRNRLAQYLLDEGIYTTLRYHPLHLNRLYGQTMNKLFNSERLNNVALNIPLHPRLTDEEVEFIVDRIRKFYEK